MMHELIEDELADLLAVPNLGFRVRAALSNYEIYRDGKFESQPIQTMAQLLAMEPEELMRIPNFGRRSLNMLQQALADRGLRLGNLPSIQRWRDVLDEMT